MLGLLAAVVVGGTAYAITSGSGSTIKACVSKHNGALYVKAKCGKGYRSISWNEVGPRGATGATGATGSAGATGSQGAAATISPLTWTPLSLENGWVNYGDGVAPASVAIDQVGMVHLRGGVASGTTGLIAILPTQYRPHYDVYTVDYGYDGVAEAIEIGPNGDIYVWDVGSSVTTITKAAEYTSLENISFSTSS